MYFSNIKPYFSIPLIVLFACNSTKPVADKMVQVKEHAFSIAGKPYRYIGVNYWHAAMLGINAQDRKRLDKELDFLKEKGVDNIRVLGASEGVGQIHGVQRVQPSYQPSLHQYNDELLIGLDYLLTALNKRNMKAVIFLGNNWEWSGGFLQYLNWRGGIADSVLPRKLSWDEMRDYVSKFYSCASCIEDQKIVTKRIVERTNSISGKKYIEDPAIMSWELANEPRPMRPAAINDYLKWAGNTSAFIKSIDSNHLVTAGVEGWMGTETLEVFEKLHTIPSIDYTTIHIWPKNWSWFADTTIQKSLPVIFEKTKAYIEEHTAIATKLNKPMVLEEFGLPRDQHLFSPSTTTHSRDAYFEFVFNLWQQQAKINGAFAGINLWGYSGFGKAANTTTGHWNPGDDYLGDPPMEEQGLNSIFSSDVSTWKLIEQFIKTIPGDKK